MLSYRLSKVFNDAEESDFYSKDGLTWDKTADDISFYLMWGKFRRSLLEETGMLDQQSTSLDGLSEEALAFINRVETRGTENA